MAKKKDFFEEKLKQFWQKGFNEQEKAEFEQFLAENPFEQEAFEGLRHLDRQTFEKDIAELTQKLPKQEHSPVFSFRMIAASVLILGGIVGIIWWLAQSMSLENSIALQKNESNTQKTESFTYAPETT
ncbi:MAG: hypothetical protein RMJ97_06035, partial [Raineya sp.]|nr:hypothetical protein [Raineya sp.]